jgi:transcriptional regulator with XRE-family HTH domain
MDVREFVGRRLRRRRRLMDMTQQDLGAACGVTFQTIQKYESASARLSADMLWKLACALKVDVAYFFTGLAEQAPPAALANDDAASTPGLRASA